MSPAAVPCVIPFDGPFTHGDCARLGFASCDVRRWLRQGIVTRLSRGVYLPAGIQLHADSSLTPAAFGGSRIVSATMAARSYGLLLPLQVHPSAQSAPRSDSAHKEHSVVVDGASWPSRAWAALQLARFQELPDALIPLDSALRLGVHREELLAGAKSMKQWRGTQVLARAIQEANPLSESALESLTRGSLLLAGAPTPLLQGWICATQNYRVDFLWPESRLILEADGRVKYSTPDQMWAEKQRQSNLQGAGFEVWRCLWRDVASPDTPYLRKLVARLAT